MSVLTPLLYKAILSMDAYNRGYGGSIDFNIYGPLDGSGNKTIIKASDSINTMIGNAYVYETRGGASAKDAGFYGIAYSLSGQTIISYRGTDSPLGSAESGGSDTLHGYGIGAGLPTTSSQGDMAINFYKDVAQKMYGATVDPHAVGLNISLTGHSLGGGLAGLVGANDNYDTIKSQAA